MRRGVIAWVLVLGTQVSVAEDRGQIQERVAVTEVAACASRLETDWTPWRVHGGFVLPDEPDFQHLSALSRGGDAQAMYSALTHLVQWSQHPEAAAAREEALANVLSAVGVPEMADEVLVRVLLGRLLEAAGFRRWVRLELRTRTVADAPASDSGHLDVELKVVLSALTALKWGDSRVAIPPGGRNPNVAPFDIEVLTIGGSARDPSWTLEPDGQGSGQILGRFSHKAGRPLRIYFFRRGRPLHRSVVLGAAFVSAPKPLEAEGRIAESLNH